MPRKGQLTGKDFPHVKGHCRFCGCRLTGRRWAWCSKKCIRKYRLMTDWSLIRSIVMRRDKYRCRLCGSRATEVDHIVELADGGSFHDQKNLRALCKSCHCVKTKAAAKARKERLDS